MWELPGQSEQYSTSRQCSNDARRAQKEEPIPKNVRQRHPRVVPTIRYDEVALVLVVLLGAVGKELNAKMKNHRHHHPLRRQPHETPWL